MFLVSRTRTHIIGLHLMINNSITSWERDAFKIQNLMLTKLENILQRYACMYVWTGQDVATPVKIFGPLFRFDSGLAGLGWDH